MVSGLFTRKQSQVWRRPIYTKPIRPKAYSHKAYSHKAYSHHAYSHKAYSHKAYLHKAYSAKAKAKALWPEEMEFHSSHQKAKLNIKRLMGREEGEEEEGRWTGNGFDMHRHVVPSLGIFFSNNPLPSFRSIAQLASYRLSCVPSAYHRRWVP